MKKFIAISVGGLVAFMVLGMIVSAIYDLQPSEIKSINLIDEWKWYRIAFYLLVIVSWTQICRFIVPQKRDNNVDAEDEILRLKEKREKDISYMKSQLWKVVAFFLFFEIIIIQQLGL